MRFNSAASLVVSVILLLATDASGQDLVLPAVQSLQGHSAVYVDLMWYDRAPPGRFDDLREDAEAQLRSHGIEILDNVEWYRTVGMPTLKIEMIVTQVGQQEGAQAWTMAVIVGFWQDVETLSGVSVKRALTWQGGGYLAPFACTPDTCDKIALALIELQLDEFANDLRVANGS